MNHEQLNNRSNPRIMNHEHSNNWTIEVSLESWIMNIRTFEQSK